MKAPTIIPLALTTLLAACAGSGADVEPILDGAPAAHFQDDLAACRDLARSQTQLDRQVLAAAALGAGVGAVLGEADEDADALGGAVAGALAGGAAAASDAGDKREEVVLACLKGRGHPVVG